MPLTRTARRIAAWIALLAVALATLAPAVSHAIGAQTPEHWIEICTANGARWVQGDAEPGDRSAPTGIEHALEHCPFCGSHAGTLGMPPAPGACVPAAPLGDAWPAAFLSAPRTLHAWLSAQPRAPPSLG